MTYDVKIGPGAVVITTTDEGAAQRIAKAIEAERKHLFQCDGLATSVAKSDRDAGLEAESPEAPAKPAKGGRR